MNWNQLYPIIDKKFNAARCLDRVRAIYDTDHWNDFSVYEKTADYCAQSMKNAGLEQIEKLPLKADGKTLYGDWDIPMAWKVHHGKLWYADGELVCDYHQKPCSLTMYSPSTPGPVEAEVVDVTGWAELPKDGSLAGKIILTEKRAAGIYAEATKAGAIGILSDQMMLYPGVRDSRQELYDECPWDGLPHKDTSNRLFAFKLTPRQADALREQLKHGPVRMIADVKTESYEGVNYTVSGALMGADPTAPEVFAYAHLYEPGANDNASGSAALLELAECFREAIEEGLLPRPKRAIRFAMGRECAGSMGYMTCHPEKDFLCAGVFDMVGTEKIDRATLSVRYDPISNWSFADAAIRASVRLYEQYSGNATNFRHNHFRLGLGTDNIVADPCFRTPAVAMVASPATSYHSSMDTPDRIEPEILKRNAMILGVYLYGLASADADTCTFLQQEILDFTAQEQANANHPGKKQHNTEAMERALYSLNRIEPGLCSTKPAEVVPPMPDYAMEDGAMIPVRTVQGCLTMATHKPNGVPKYRVAWNAVNHIPLFWTDGKRNLWQITVQSAYELGECTDQQLQEKFRYMQDYFAYLTELGYIIWK